MSENQIVTDGLIFEQPRDRNRDVAKCAIALTGRYVGFRDTHQFTNTARFAESIIAFAAEAHGIQRSLGLPAAAIAKMNTGVTLATIYGPEPDAADNDFRKLLIGMASLQTEPPTEEVTSWQHDKLTVREVTVYPFTLGNVALEATRLQQLQSDNTVIFSIAATQSPTEAGQA